MTSMIAEITVAILALVGTLVGSLMSNQKTVWRIEQLEAKVDRHNKLVERVAILERDEQTQWKEIDKLRDRLDKGEVS